MAIKLLLNYHLVKSEFLMPNRKPLLVKLATAEHSTQKLTKAGQKRLRGIRPTVRGVAQNPHSHPHGGGEGRSSIGMHPKTPWGKPAFKRTRKRKKASNKLIVKRRKNNYVQKF